MLLQMDSLPPWRIEQLETEWRERTPWWWNRPRKPLPDFPGAMNEPNEFRVNPPAYHWGPRPNRPSLISSQHNIFLIDPDGYFIGFDENWGEGGPLARTLYAGRTRGTRNF